MLRSSAALFQAGGFTGRARDFAQKHLNEVAVPFKVSMMGSMEDMELGKS